MFADVFVIITEQNSLSVDQGEVFGVLLRRERVVGKPKGDVVAQFPVPGDDDEVRIARPEDGIGEMAASSLVNMSSRFSQRID